MTQFLESRPDFYNKQFDEKQYAAQLDLLANIKSHEALYITSKGIAVAGLIQQFVFRILGILGFERPTNVIRVRYEILKFLHYGASRQYLTQPEIASAIERVKVSQLFMKSYAIKVRPFTKAFIGSVAMTNADKNSRNQNSLQGHLKEYYNQHHHALRPSVYRRCIATKISEPYCFFGSTYLALAEKTYASIKTFDAKKLNELNAHFQSALSLSRHNEQCQQIVLKRLCEIHQSLKKEFSGDISQIDGAFKPTFAAFFTHNMLSKSIVELWQRCPDEIRNDEALRTSIREARLAHSKTITIPETSSAISFLKETVAQFASQTDLLKNSKLYQELMSRYYINSNDDELVKFYESLPFNVRQEQNNAQFALRKAFLMISKLNLSDHALKLCTLAGVTKHRAQGTKELFQQVYTTKIIQLLTAENSADEKLAKAESASTATTAAIATTTSATIASPKAVDVNPLKKVFEYYEEAVNVMGNSHLDMPVEHLQRLLDLRANESVEKEDKEARSERHSNVVWEFERIRGAATPNNGYEKLQIPEATVDYYLREHDFSADGESFAGYKIAFELAEKPGSFNKAMQLFDRIGLDLLSHTQKNTFVRLCVKEIEVLFATTVTATTAATQSSQKENSTADAWNYYLKAVKASAPFSINLLTFSSLDVVQGILNSGADQKIPNETVEAERVRHYQIVEQYNAIFSKNEDTSLMFPQATYDYWNKKCKDKTDVSLKPLLEIVLRTKGKPALATATALATSTAK